MRTDERNIDSPEAMIRAVRRFGILPFFRNAVPGWSVEEMTAPGYWFFEEEDELGPWDWKVEVVREGDIAYGKFLGGKAAFATVPWYRELMNWRRSLPKYRMALGGKYAARTAGEKLMQSLSPVALSAIREAGALESRELRLKCAVKKNIMDSVTQFLQMGTWTVIGDIQRVYRGPDLHYSGWQRASHTTPDELFGGDSADGNAPFWAQRFSDRSESGAAADCSPEESRRRLIDHVLGFFPETDAGTLQKII